MEARLETIETADYPPALYDLVPFLVAVTGRDSVAYLLEHVHRPAVRSRILLRILELCGAEPENGRQRDAALTVYLWVLALSGYSELLRVAAREVSRQHGCRMAGALVWLLVGDVAE